MSSRLLVVPQIGEVVLTKRRGSTNIRLSINASGQVRVGMPYWIPYEAGLLFVKKHRQWIQDQLTVHSPKQLTNGSRIGKTHYLAFIKSQAKNGTVEARVDQATIKIRTLVDTAHPAVQEKALLACERALKREAGELLTRRLEVISHKHKLPYRNLKIRKLTSRWGSCTSKKDISLSYFLVQLPWELIDYVLLHELAHTVFPNHSRDFWSYMEERLPDVRELRKQIKSYKPRVEPG